MGVLGGRGGGVGWEGRRCGVGGEEVWGGRGGGVGWEGEWMRMYYRYMKQHGVTITYKGQQHSLVLCVCVRACVCIQVC